MSNMIDHVDAAEKEASEVLHSLLSVERIEDKQALNRNQEHQVVVVTSDVNVPVQNENSGQHQDEGGIHWHTPVAMQQTLFTNMTQFGSEQVIWQVGDNGQGQTETICIPTVQTLQTLGDVTFAQPPTCPTNGSSANSQPKIKTPSKGQNSIKEKKTPVSAKKKQKLSELMAVGIDPNQLEENAQQVKERFEKGCECQEENCFKGLNPEYVYKHRLNIAELTKAEHDMYLMGVTMAVLTNPEETVRHKERRRLRAQYVFQGRRVCLDAFLYLENCTHYQLKRIRKHVMTHGVQPRVHGNHGKKPHNRFPLASYRHATSFLKFYIDRYTSSSPNAQSVVPSPAKAKSKSNNKSAPLYLPSDITRKTIHNAYKEYCEHFEPSIKVMGYSTFRHFMKEQFSHVKFCKLDASSPNKSTNNVNQIINNSGIDVKSQQCSKQPRDEVMTLPTEPHHQDSNIIRTDGSDLQQLTIPIVLNGQANGMMQRNGMQEQAHQTTYIVTPVSQILQTPLNGNSAPGGNTFTSYQFTSSSPSTYTTHQQITQTGIAVASVQTNTQQGTYAFTAL